MAGKSNVWREKIKLAKNIHANSLGHVDRCGNYGCSLLLTAFNNCAVCMSDYGELNFDEPDGVFTSRVYGLG